MNIWGGLPRWAQLAILCIGGVLLIALKAPVDELSHTFGEILRDVGIAALVAGLFALTLERWFRQDLNKDVFEAVLGYLPPTSYKNELLRLIRYPFICEDHTLRFKIEDQPKGLVRVTVTSERKLKNITSRRQPIKGYYHIDEWGFAERSRIVECVMEVDGQVYEGETQTLDDMTIKSVTVEKMIPPGGMVRLGCVSTEIKRSNDELNILFGTPTVEPVIQVDLPRGLQYVFSFGPDDPEIEPSMYGGQQRLKGTYFPGQRMRVRWWPKKVAG